MSTTVIDGCALVTMDADRTEHAVGHVVIEGARISSVGAGPAPRDREATYVDGRGCLATPGLVNTHHHLYQWLTRGFAVDHTLFEWLTTLYPVWACLDEDTVRTGATGALAQLARTGCTTTMDHHYVFPDGVPNLLEAEIDAAREIGIRFLGTRGSMDLSVKDGGLPPDSVVQDIDSIIAHSEEVVGRYHDPAPGSMLQIGIAPCSPFSVTDRLMVESATQARRLGVRLHTHIAETVEEEEHCLGRFGLRPLELLDDRGWLGPDVWLAHCVQLNDRDIGLVAETGTGVAWCPTSNLRVVGGIAPARALLDRGATVGLGVDGSASNDVGNMALEARMAMLVPRAVGGTGAMSARDALRVATRGGAGCLGRPELGSLEVGKRADVALFAADGLTFAGAEADLVAGVLLCPGPRVRHLFVEGRPVVRDGRLVNADEDQLVASARRVAARLPAASGAGR